MLSHLIAMAIASLIAHTCANPVPDTAAGMQKRGTTVWQWDVKTTIENNNGSAPVIVDEIFEFTTMTGGKTTFKSVSKSTAPVSVDHPRTVIKTVLAPVPSSTSTHLPIGTSTRPPSTTSTKPPGVSTTTSTTPPATSTPASTSLQNSVLDLHNKLRAVHNAPALAWNDTLAAYASTSIAACVAKHSGGPYGENLAWGYTNATDAVQAWYDEYKLYSYENPVYAEDDGHFTQLVWRDARQLGCSMKLCDGTGNILMCEYDVGNVIGEFAQNVLPQVS